MEQSKECRNDGLMVHHENVPDIESEIQPQSIQTTEFTKAMLESLIDQTTPNNTAMYPCPICMNTAPILLYQHLYQIHGLRGYELNMWLREARMIQSDA